MNSHGGPYAPEEPKTDPRRYLAAVLRHKWLVVLLTLAGAAAGFALSRRVEVIYQAQATLWIQVGGERAQSGPIQPAQLLQWSSWVDLLRSFEVLDQVVRERRLFLVPKTSADTLAFQTFQLQPRFVPGAYKLTVGRGGTTYTLTRLDREIEHGNVGDSVGAKVGFAWVPSAEELRPGRVIEFHVRTPRDAALALRSNLSTEFPSQGSFLSVKLTWSNPIAAAGLLNAIDDRFVGVAAQLKRQKLSQLSAILQEQLTSAKNSLESSENALETFRVHTITEPSEQSLPVAAGLQQTRDPVFARYFNMRIQRDQLAHDRDAIDSALVQPDTTLGVMSLEAIPSVQSSSELSQALTQLTSKEAEARSLRLQFAPTYPRLRQLNTELADLEGRVVPSLARNLSAELAARVRDMDSQIASASRQLQAIPERTIEEARLKRNQNIAEQLYTNLQQRYEEARLAEVSSIPDVRVLDAAVTPEKPLKNKAIMLLLGGVLGGFGGAVVLTLLLDRVDRRVRYPDQVQLEMGLPILGALPRLRNGRRQVGQQAEAPVVEALRAIRLNLEHAYGTAGPLVTTITSPAGGDGKSFLASNLAVSFADAGHRTLVIDGDIRRGSLHRVFGLQRKPGLLDYLTGDATQDVIVQRTAIKGVEFIGGGTRRNAGPELLASAAMSQLLIGLRGSYGVIILDCAPLGAGVDPLVLGTLTGSLVMVLRTGVTDREFAMAKLEAISRLPIRVLGAVLNDVKPGDAYGYYSYYGYLPGYETSEEPADAAGAKRLTGGSEVS
jgi:succinoglycan biosynthesis transport protein ExoP